MAKFYWAMPENTEKVMCVPNQTGAAIGAGVYVGCRNVRKMFAVVDFVYGADVDCVVTVLQAPLVDGVDPVAMSNALPMWASTDTTATSVIPEITAATSYTFDAGAGKNQTLVIQIEPIDMDEPVGAAEVNTAITVNIGNSDAANNISVDLYVIPREFKKSLLVD